MSDLATQSVEAWNKGDRILAYTLLSELLKSQAGVDLLLAAKPPRDYMGAMVRTEAVDGKYYVSVVRPTEMA